MTVPYAAQNSTGYHGVCNMWFAMDNGSASTFGNGSGEVAGRISANTTTVAFTRTDSGTGWTSSGTKSVRCDLIYEADSI